MNQILCVEKPKNKSSLDIDQIVKIFVISIIFFGIIFIGKGIFGIITSKGDVKALIPVVTVSEVDEELQINITHDKAIDKIVYSWNNGKETVLQGKGRTNIQEIIQIPVGTNILNLKVVDIKNKETKISNKYYKSDEDITEPQIELVVEGSKVKIVAKDERKLEYIMYRWNDEDDTVVQAREDSSKQIEEKISILKGENKLIVLAVDEAGNETTKEQIFKGAKKPTIEVNQDGNQLLIKVKDEENIQKIEIELNGEHFSTDFENTGEPLNMTDVEFTQNLQAGENNITITAYSVSGLSEQITKTITI